MTTKLCIDCRRKTRRKTRGGSRKRPSSRPRRYRGGRRGRGVTGGSKKKQRKHRNANKNQSNESLTTTITTQIEPVRGFELTYSSKVMAAKSKGVKAAIIEFTSAIHEKKTVRLYSIRQQKSIPNQHRLRTSPRIFHPQQQSSMISSK